MLIMGQKKQVLYRKGKLCYNDIIMYMLIDGVRPGRQKTVRCRLQRSQR